MGNSVIYRPAYDAEVEYLESTGTQYIDTGVYPDNTYTFDCKVATTHIVDGNYVFWGCRDWQNAIIAQCFLFVSNMSSYDGEKIRLITTNSWADNVNWNSGIVPTPNTMYELVGMTSVSTMNAVNSTIAIFGLTTNGVTSASSSICRIGYWKCYSNGQIIRDFIPVRIGSVGYLYDKVSKQLFANKGTGNFILGNDVSNAVIPQQRCVLYFGSQRSVGFERIYEEYEWLCGDGSAVINTNIEDITNLTELYCYFYSDNPSVSERIFGREGTSRIVLRYPSVNNIDFFTSPNNNPSYITLGFNTEGYFYADFVANQASTSLSSPTNFIGNSDKIGNLGTIYLFGDKVESGPTSIVSAKIKSFRAAPFMDLVPVKLLRPIPAILDGNGIARQAGECGMWDKVSNRFYGNVASSGTFTVKNPKCYEEYDTLLMDNGGATIPSGGSYFILSNDISLTNKVFTVNLGDTYRDLTINGDTVDGSKYMISIFTYSSGSTTIQERYGNNNIIGTITAYSSKIVILDFQNNVATVGTHQFNIQGTGYKFSDSTTTYWSRIKYLKNITVDNELNLIPCKLTHGIPASMDANGIARPAGTCGMWDKVNDKFYGNVANSGTFTVSND